MVLFFEYIINESKELLKKKNTVLFVAVGNGQQEIFRQLEDNNKIFNKRLFYFVSTDLVDMKCYVEP